MEGQKSGQLNRESWILGALELLAIEGLEGVRIVPLAKRLGVTSGSFYWHFKNRRELHDAVLAFWEREMTDVAIEKARNSTDAPKERIWKLMEQVMEVGMASYDLAIWHWAQSDNAAQKIFSRALEKRFQFARWMFEQAGFDEIQAETRGRMMVVYMMGESTLISDDPPKRKELLRLKYQILTNT